MATEGSVVLVSTDGQKYNLLIIMLAAAQHQTPTFLVWTDLLK